MHCDDRRSRKKRQEYRGNKREGLFFRRFSWFLPASKNAVIHDEWLRKKP
jgi:hypothetical protein